MEEIMLISGIVLLTTACLYAGLIGLFTFGWYRKKVDFSPSDNKTELKVSVIVAFRNEEKHIANLINDLVNQDYPSSWMEILLIDDHSEDNTVEIIRNTIEIHRNTIEIDRNKIEIHRNTIERDRNRIEIQELPGFRLIDLTTNNITDGFTRQPETLFTRQPEPLIETKMGKKAAITAGIRHAAGDVILVTDADCRVGPSWVSSMVSYFKDDKRMMVFGPVAYFPGKRILDRFQSLEYSGLVASGAGAALAGKPFMCSGANLAYRKEAFLKVNGYEGNEKFISGDDVFLMHKMKEDFGNQSIGFVKNINATVRTYPAPGLLTFFRQRIRWASKTKGYTDKLATFTAIIVFLLNLLIIISLIGGFWHHGLFLIYAAGMLVKSLVEFPLMWGITGFNKERRLMAWYFPFQLVYPFYVLSAGVSSMFAGKKW